MEPTFALNIAAIAEGVFFFLLFIFSVYGLFLVYHWYTFGTSKSTSLVALTVYLVGGAILFLTLATGIRMI